MDVVSAARARIGRRRRLLGAARLAVGGSGGRRDADAGTGRPARLRDRADRDGVRRLRLDLRHVTQPAPRGVGAAGPDAGRATRHGLDVDRGGEAGGVDAAARRVAGAGHTDRAVATTGR
ncbi:MAG: hypothetical protein M5U27_01665 [Gaiella sp.]|nr:hypothetical protein [Gaiella sp.]